jgi:hypothetical protein
MNKIKNLKKKHHTAKKKKRLTSQEGITLFDWLLIRFSQWERLAGDWRAERKRSLGVFCFTPSTLWCQV